MDRWLGTIMYIAEKVPDGIPSRTHLQVIVYYALKALGMDTDEAGFVCGHQGPHSRFIEDCCDALVDDGCLVEESDGRLRVSAVCVTPGIPPSDPLDASKAESLIRYLSRLSSEELLLHVFTDDAVVENGMEPDTKTMGVVLDRRVEIARGMVIGGKASIMRGAELADMDPVVFMGLIDSATNGASPREYGSD
ncbi:MAG: hypothetical protein Q4Q58_03700 [Thermoplasmata archaeon]|nr:hypothetical protein [Thermoplasmata archaeon]